MTARSSRCSPSTDGLGLLLTGTSYCDMAVPLLFDETEFGEPMGSACDQADITAYRGDVLSMKL